MCKNDKANTWSILFRIPNNHVDTVIQWYFSFERLAIIEYKGFLFGMKVNIMLYNSAYDD